VRYVVEEGDADQGQGFGAMHDSFAAVCCGSDEPLVGERVVYCLLARPADPNLCIGVGAFVLVDRDIKCQSILPLSFDRR
jgi:hypothetical protein